MKSGGASKLGKLQLHFSSASHKAALSDYSHFLLKRGHIDLLLSKENRTVMLESEKILLFNTEIIKILIDIVKTMTKQGIAFRGSDDDKNSNFHQLVQLVSRHNPSLKRWLHDTKLRPYHATYLSADSQNEFISLIGNAVRKEVVREINSSPFYTIMADTTPDRSHKDIMGVVIRSTDENAVPRERLLQAMEIIDKTGLGMAKMIINSIDKNEIDRNRLVFQSYDFAAAMSGEYNGVHKHMSDFVDHKVPYVPCQPHRCNIAIEHACNASTIISNMYSILQEVFTFFSSSSKRYQPLLEKMETIENSLHLRNLSLTRWTARAESIQAVNNSFEIIIDVLSEVTISSRDEKKTNKN